MTIKITTVFLFYLFYWFCCFLGTGTDRKNLTGLRSYPDAVQREVRAHPELGKAAPQEKSLLSILLGNLLLFTVVFSVLGLALKGILGLHDFGAAFWFFLALGEGLGLFDLVLIDLIWWRSTKRIRFSFLPERHHIKTLASTSAPSSGVSRCLRLWPFCRRWQSRAHERVTHDRNNL